MKRGFETKKAALEWEREFLRQSKADLDMRFTSNVFHELKAPLTSISGFAEMMKSGGTPETVVVDFFTSIYDEAQRLIMEIKEHSC